MPFSKLGDEFRETKDHDTEEGQQSGPQIDFSTLSKAALSAFAEGGVRVVLSKPPGKHPISPDSTEKKRPRVISVQYPGKSGLGPSC